MTTSPTARAEIAALLSQWCAALESGNATQVTALYAEDATLLPTISNQTRNSLPEIRAYFDQFMALRPKARMRTQNISVYERIAINSGVYSFQTTTDGVTRDLVCRFTFVYRKDPTGWRIIEHHSSMMPEAT